MKHMIYEKILLKASVSVNKVRKKSIYKHYLLSRVTHESSAVKSRYQNVYFTNVKRKKKKLLFIVIKKKKKKNNEFPYSNSRY